MRNGFCSLLDELEAQVSDHLDDLAMTDRQVAEQATRCVREGRSSAVA